ncbi:hypothetical protein CDAR_413041 [Caerostris darwini]|uniref:Uncharacterized protein n=1 Tax=Caerostris darwini TaxID=1538125 RepID=A0AAV4R8V5_9ARAC|nr:hypothetical protein CDAR_413041 [Caerostris darwini]
MGFPFPNRTGEKISGRLPRSFDTCCGTQKERVPFATPGNGSLQWASRIDASAAPKHAGKGPPVAMATVRAAHDVGGGGERAALSGSTRRG